MCFQDHSPFQKHLTKQKLLKPLNSNNNFFYMFEIMRISILETFLLRKQVILNSKLYNVLTVDDVVQAAR